MTIEINQQRGIDAFLRGRINQMKREYIRATNRDLSQHNHTGCLARNIHHQIKLLIQDVHAALSNRTLELPVDGGGIADGDKKVITDLIQEFTQAALQHNRTSCALSNFGVEHVPDQGYLDEIVSGINKLLGALDNRIQQSTN